MFIFGVLALLLGVIGIASPDTLLSLLGFTPIPRAARLSSDFTLVFIISSCMASFNMGVYYILSALVDYRPFYTWTVPFRCVTFTVFTLVVVTGLAPARFPGIGRWERPGAILTGAALLYDRKHTPAPALALPAAPQADSASQISSNTRSDAHE